MSDNSIDSISREAARSLAALRALNDKGLLHPSLHGLMRLAPPPGMEAQVDLLRRNSQRKIRRDAQPSEWDHATSGAWITYAPAKEIPDRGGADVVAESTAVQPVSAVDVVRVVAQAEQGGSYDFLGLTLVRDRLLPQLGPSWASSPQRRQAAIGDAIARGWLRTGKVANPIDPDRPTTSVELNREHPDVRRILEGGVSKSDDLDPIVIRGEPLSETIRRERR